MTANVLPIPAAQPTYITFSTDVNPQSTALLLSHLSNCANQGVTEVHLLISTNGGSIMHGVNIYNVLRGMPYKVVTHNVGNVDSIGNAIYLAGQDRYACASSTFMFHGVGLTPPAGTTFDSTTMQNVLMSLISDEARLVDIVTQHTSMSKTEVKGLYKGHKTMTAVEAKTAGIVHDIRELNIPQGAPTVMVG